MKPSTSEEIAARHLRQTTWLLLAISGVLGVICIRAEELSLWFVAQGSFAAILILLALITWEQSRRLKRIRALPSDAVTYGQTLDKLLVFVVGGIIAILFNAIRYEYWRRGLVARAAGYGVLVAGAAFITGVLVGFLFGVPSNVGAPQGSEKQAPPPGGGSGPGTNNHPTQSSSSLYNTNLDQIADWLTKVILGASLVELNKLPPLIGDLATYMSRGIDPTGYIHPDPPVALAILGYFWSCGILYGYIWTKYEIAATSRKASDDPAALAAVDRWLSQPPGPKDDLLRAEMVGLVKGASAGAKVRIFLQAEKHRRPSSADANERALPILQALVEADSQEIFHRNRSICAFALMGKKSPEWASALDLLNEAIRIRDRYRDQGSREYEVARAVCQIRLDPQYSKGAASAADLAAAILADLQKGKEILADPSGIAAGSWKAAIDDWRKINNVTP